MLFSYIVRKPALVLVSALLLALSLSINVYASDLPIDITAIGRQERPASQFNTRIGSHLFTDDAQVINELLAEQIKARQASTLYLFASVSANNIEIDNHTQLMANADNMALFSQPVHHGSFNIPVEEELWPWWLIAFIIGTCSLAGFVWAMISNAKKKERALNVH